MTIPHDEWIAACDRAKNCVLNSHTDSQAEIAIEMAQRLLALAHHLAGVACGHCTNGRRAYASTATWLGGIGGQAITVDVCDRCWGTGRSDVTGADLRRGFAALKQAERERDEAREKARRWREVASWLARRNAERDPEGNDYTLRTARDKAMRRALRVAGDNRTEASRLLGVSLRSVHRWIKENGENP